MTPTLYPFQRAGIDRLKRLGRGLLADDVGLGKGQPYGSKVLTANGWKSIEDITVTDKCFASSGRQVVVMGVYHRPVLPCYRINFSDGTSLVVDKDHLHILRTANDRCRYKGAKWRVYSTEKLLSEKLRFGIHNQRQFDIPVVQPLQFGEKEQPIKPYTFGVLLGDGSFRGRAIKVTLADEEILLKVSKEVASLNCKLTKNGKWDWRFNKKNKRMPDGVLMSIQDMGLMGHYSFEKHIPDMYLYGSVEQRIELLRGLMDTDGTIQKEGTCQFCSTSEQLALQVRFLIQSLGGCPTLSSKSTYYKKEGRRVTCKDCHILTFSLKGINPFFLKRKSDRWNPEPRDNGRWIDSIEYVGNMPTVCLSVASKDRSYVTENCIVTHNTAQILNTIAELDDPYPALIVCPAVLKLQWQRESEKFIDYSPLVLGSLKPWAGVKQLRDEYISVINYDVLAKWLPVLRAVGYRTVIGDEGHRISALYGNQSLAFRTLCIGVPHVYIVTATAMVNYPAELWPIVSTLWPDEFDSIFTFMYRYCEDQEQTGNGRRKWKGARNTGELNARLRSLGMIRRTKEQVLPELPPLRRYVVPLELSDPEEYRRAERDFLSWLSSWDPKRVNSAARAVQFAKFGYMKRLSAELKLESICDWLDNWLENNTGKLLVGGIHRESRPFVVKELYQRYSEVAVTIHGGRNEKERYDAMTAFQGSDWCRMLVGQLKSCGEGLNLQAANCVVHTELPWNATSLKQFAGRAHRIGTKSPVDEYFMVADCLVEQELCELIQRKERWASDVLDGKPITKQSTNIFDELGAALLAKSKGVSAKA